MANLLRLISFYGQILFHEKKHHNELTLALVPCTV